MKSLKFLHYILLVFALTIVASCKDFLDVNVSPNATLDAPMEQVLTTATTTVGFFAGSDLHRYSALIAQQFSGQGSGATTQPQEYERYNIQGSDANNVWTLVYASALSDLDIIVQKAATESSPHYAGVAKILKAYLFQVIVDTWGKAPYSEAFQTVNNVHPKFDDGQAIYDDLVKQLDQAIVDINSTSSLKSPGSNSTIYPGAWAASKPRWERLANTLKLRMLIHQSKLRKQYVVDEITKLVNANANFMTANADNFQMAFVNTPNNQNPIHQFEVSRPNQFFPNATLVDLMNSYTDPRRPRYFTPFPFTRPVEAGAFKGAKAGDAPSIAYSRMHSFLRGDTTNSAPATAIATGANTGGLNASGTGAYAYTGAAPIRMLTFAEYNFIRAEAAVYGAPGDAQTFFQAGIRASMQAAGLSTSVIDAYITANGTLPADEPGKIRRIIEEKFVANYGVILEPWSDWRRTGVPTLPVPANALFSETPRSLFYPQAEIDLNLNAPRQKNSPAERVFWDVQ
ncbi:MAG TPA: SusD/RagB family nutrient-binding outer membrane lipoprotein [Saprospiraceae bacterium]|nr:SusD/RagB family nutrient-binding outer membrane lipoprotein [Saprospiraceae bacterium]